MPRAGLTADRVVEEAETMADEIGLSRLTLAALAERLGVRQPSLYKHIESADGLQRSIAVRAKRELAETLGRAAVGLSRGDATMSMSHAYRVWALQHPGRYMAAQSASKPDDSAAGAADVALVKVTFDVLAGYGLTGDDAIDATRALRSALHGFVTLEAAGGFGLPADIDRSFDRLMRGLESALANWNPPQPRKPRRPTHERTTQS